ncbi:MAG: alpha/beta hydrolase [Proteobacteria bacterium]|nr:alpha/beta hydrolase [Pseudomonadota bacterium]
MTGEGIKLAYREKPGSSGDVVLCIHGLGDAGSSFAPLFETGLFSHLTLVALDMPGCGKSARPSDFSYSMEDQAELVCRWIEQSDYEKITLAGHSMGGIIALFAAERLPRERIAAFINIEGNLGPEDCFFSGLIASWAEEDFEKEGFFGILEKLRGGTPHDPKEVMEKYTANFAKALPRAIYRSSVSLMLESTHGNLKERFSALPCPKAFISGERSLTPSLARWLEKNHILHFTVPQSGHFMMIEQQENFYEVFLRILEKTGKTLG